MEDIVDMDLQQLLTSWNLPHLYELLHNHRITIDVLPILKPHHISKLFNNSHIADEAKFELHLDKYKENVNKQEYQMTGNGDKRKYTPIRNNFSVSDILDNTQSGKLILKYYSKHNTLHDEQRTLLITTISKYLLESGIECSVSSCAGLEKEVCSIFPTEKIEFYQSGNRGKIYNKLANMKRIQKGILKSVNTPEETHSDAFETEENYSVALKNLRCPTVTSEELVIYWRQCAQYRFKEIKESESIKHIFEKWPEYTKSSATQLIEIDFEIKFPMAKNIKSRWSSCDNKILHYLKSKISSSIVVKTLNKPDLYVKEESKTFAVFWYLHYLFPPPQKVAADEVGIKYRKKYTIIDSQESFAMVGETQEELDAKINLLKLQNRIIEPKLLIVGDVNNIKSISILFNEHRYNFLKILDAVDILFKIFYVFNLQYPVESNIFYNFLQDFLYDIPLKKKCAKISTVKNEILNFNI